MHISLTRYLALYGALIAVARPAIVGVLIWWLWIGLSRLPIRQAERVSTWLAVAIPLVAWLSAIWVLARAGVFEPPIPALPVAIIAPLLVGVLILGRSERVRAALDAIPPSWLIGLQVYRVLGGTFIVVWALGGMPGAFALPAGIGDVTVGLLALPAAAYLASGAPAGRTVAVGWNVLGITDLVSALTLGSLIGQRAPSFGAYPIVMTPAFAVPLSGILHGLSLRQLRRQAAAQAR